MEKTNKINPKVSIIIPVYNSERYIERCINSILNNTYKNIEIIIINDGSTDSSEKIILQLKKENDEIIKYYYKTNEGPAKARNLGIKLATGKYLMFVDNDDYIDYDYVEKLVNEAESKNYDMVICGFRRVNSKNKIFFERKLSNTRWCRYINNGPWARICNRDYILKNKIEFLDCNYGEDIFFNVQAVSLSKNVGIIEYVGYNWFYNTKSITYTTQKDFYNLELYKFINETYSTISKKGILENKEEKECIQLLFFIICISVFGVCGKSLTYKQFIAEYNKLFNWMEEKFPNYKKMKLKLKGYKFSEIIRTKIFFFLHKINLGAILLFWYVKLVR